MGDAKSHCIMSPQIENSPRSVNGIPRTRSDFYVLKRSRSQKLLITTDSRSSLRFAIPTAVFLEALPARSIPAIRGCSRKSFLRPVLYQAKRFDDQRRASCYYQLWTRWSKSGSRHAGATPSALLKSILLARTRVRCPIRRATKRTQWSHVCKPRELLQTPVCLQRLVCTEAHRSRVVQQDAGILRRWQPVELLKYKKTQKGAYSRVASYTGLLLLFR